MSLFLKNLKKICAAAIFAFIAFAPPGTLIVAGVFALGLLGRTWFFVGATAGLILLIVYFFVYREKILQSERVKNILRKWKIKAGGS